jgi:hypothetical protein
VGLWGGGAWNEEYGSWRRIGQGPGAQGAAR